MNYKKVTACLLAAAMITTLGACGGNNETDGAKTTAATGDSVSTDSTDADTQETSADSGEAASAGAEGELTLALWETIQEPGISEVLKDFTAETGIKVDVQVTPWEQYWTMLEAAATGGELPDVFWMHSNEIARYAQAGILMDLTDRIAASDKVDLSKFPENITEIYNWDDTYQYAIPKDFDTIALWYNKTMFDEAGISYPDDTWTWDTLRENAKLLSDASKNQYGFYAGIPTNQEGWYNMVYQNGGYIVSDDKKTSGFDDPKTIEAIDFWVDLVRDGSSPDAVITSETGHGRCLSPVT